MPAVVEDNTPIIRSEGTVMESSTADKKRNKLGYHRTSVACGKLSVLGGLRLEYSFLMRQYTVGGERSDVLLHQMMLKGDARIVYASGRNASSSLSTSSPRSRRSHVPVLV